MKLKIRDVLKNEILFSNKINIFRLLKILLVNYEKKIIFRYRFAVYLHKRKFRLIANIINNGIKKKYGVYISLNAEIDLGLKLPHPTGIVIGDKVKISKNCTIYQDVTIGGKSRNESTQTEYPVILDNVVLFAGAKVLGAIKISNNNVIGANCVVIKDTEPNSTYVGVPAYKINREEK